MTLATSMAFLKASNMLSARATVFLYILYLVFSIGSIMSNYIEVLAVKLSPTTGQGLSVGFLDAARFMGFSLGEIFGGML